MFSKLICAIVLAVASASTCDYGVGVPLVGDYPCASAGLPIGNIYGGDCSTGAYAADSYGLNALSTPLSAVVSPLSCGAAPVTRSRIVSNNCNCVKTIVSAKPNIREFAVPIRTSRVLTSVRPTYRSEVYTATPCSSSVYPAGGYVNNLAGLGLTNGYVADAGVVGPVVDSYGSSLIGGLGCSGLVPSVGDSYGSVLTGCGASLIGGCDVPVSTC